MITLHPAFDIETAMWFVEDRDLVAPSLALLKQALGPNIKFKDYYPNGFRSPAWPKTNGIIKGRLPVTTVAPTFARPTPEQSTEQTTEQITKPKPVKRSETTFKRHYDHDAILDLWAAGHTGREIAEKLGLHSTTTAATIVATYRNTDLRAKRRASTGGRRKVI